MFLPSFSLPPSSATCFVYSHFTIATKSARTPWVCNVGTSQEVSRRTSFWVCLFLGNNTHKLHCHHMKFDNNQEGMNPLNSSSLPLVCVFSFLPIYLSILPSPSPLCCYKNQGKMWRLVIVRMVGVFPNPLSFSFCLHPICSLSICFAITITMFMLCCKNKGEGFMLTTVAWALLTFFFHPQSICSHVYRHRHCFAIKRARILLALFLHPWFICPHVCPRVCCYHHCSAIRKAQTLLSLYVHFCVIFALFLMLITHGLPCQCSIPHQHLIVDVIHSSMKTTTKGAHVHQVISLDFEWIH